MAKSTPSNVNFTVSLLVTYAIAFVVTLIGFFFIPVTDGIAAELKHLNWARQVSDLPSPLSVSNTDSCSPIVQTGSWGSP